MIDAAAVALAEAGVGSPRTDAELLAAHAAATDRVVSRSLTPGPSSVERYDELVARAPSGCRCNTSPVPRHSVR